MRADTANPDISFRGVSKRYGAIVAVDKVDLDLPKGVIPPTGREMHAPCCDVFHLKDGKVVSFDCYVAVPILLEQLGVFMNLQAAFRR